MVQLSEIALHTAIQTTGSWGEPMMTFCLASIRYCSTSRLKILWSIAGDGTRHRSDLCASQNGWRQWSSPLGRQSCPLKDAETW